LGVREFFGELGLLIGDHARSADAIAATDGLLVELRHEEFQRLVDRDPSLVSYFLRRAIMRVVLNEQSLIRRLRRRNQDLEAALDSLYATTHQLN
ncbi:cyclic nucleotide-binding domain-containing protein, partial [Lysobacter sp. 2RAB21]